jgi:hypothetical protein
MIVSVTEVQSFKRCRRQWDYGSFNRQGLTPIIQPKPYLDLGTMIHKTLAYWAATYTDDEPGNLELIFTAIAAKHKATIIDNYTRATGQEPADELLDPLIDSIVLGRAMMKNYQEFHGRPIYEDMTHVSPEQEILIPIPGTEFNCCILKTLEGSAPCESCGGTGIGMHKLKARLDALAVDTHGNIYVVENKTYENRPDLMLLEVTDQFIGYDWVAQQLNAGYVAGIAYNGLWKRAQPPSRPKQLQISDLFVRTLITPSQDEVDEYGRELAETVMDMANEPRLYKNRVWAGCWDCSFEHLCRIQSQDGDVEYVKRTMYTSRTEDDVSDIASVVESAS